MSFDIYSDKELAEVLNKWLQTENEDDSEEVRVKSFVNLIIDLELKRRNIINADEEMRNQIQKKIVEQNKSVPRIGGNQTIAQEVINKILDGDIDGGIELVGNNISEKNTLIKEYISEGQRKKAQKSRPDALNEWLMDELEENPNITEPEVIEKLKKSWGEDIYIEDEDLGITVQTYDGKKTITEYVKISALKDRLSRCRAKISIK